ncbi:GNAT family N-acetyltransferase [Sphingobacterium rhinopitheci]|uniref:GNAT family N-acetyltransferase n=1 Tax=Sphingobacterium rhinopitheci TaxID=2781960 RepID=UPI001F51708A|nr:GNAT family N-acetyltransferase [Sphingobacterium rhinopitheci]MCI0920002.1 GNAT family N-acetyltransferase [Sphingobacterium rhinopitheci]
MTISDFLIIPATANHIGYAENICNEMFESAKARGTGIARRKPEYVAKKMEEGKAVIALHKDGRWAGFCYIETWGHGDYVANSGLIVNPHFRKVGLAKAIKKRVFELSREKYPKSKIFGLTTGLAVMKINSDLGYEPVTYSELTQDEEFWKGCQSCINFDILVSKERKNCMCTAMLWDPVEKERELKEKIQRRAEAKERLERISKKQSLLKRIEAKLWKSTKKIVAAVLPDAAKTVKEI